MPMPPALPVRERPWEELPPEVAAVLRPELPALSEAIIAAIAESIPEYKRPIEGSFGRGVRVGVEEALERFVRLIEDPAHHIEPTPVYRALGRGEMRAGRSLDALQAAYRLGARVAWRHLAKVAAAAELAPDTLPTLAEAIFAYIDALAAQSVEGYADAQSAAAGEHSRRRVRVLELLLDDAGADREAVQTAATRADWPLPRTLAAVALARPADADTLARRLGPDVLAGAGPHGPCLLVPDPHGPGRAERLASVLSGRAAAIGPAVEPLRAAASLRPARRLLAMAEREPAPGDPAPSGAARPLLRVDDHLADLVLDAAREPLAELAARRLAPLDGRTEATRARLAETLLAWLELQGSAPAVARRLHVHPQTVRYRLARLREALGDQLDDPEARFELLLALRGQALRGPLAGDAA
jgi:PucR-like helix-turn-helix protein